MPKHSEHSMFIQRLSIENFKRFDRFDVELRPFDCLVGPNNSGKTTVLQALALFDFCLHHCLSRRNGEYRLKNRSIPPEEFYVLPVSSPMDLWTDRRAQTGSKHVRIRIGLTFDQGAEVGAEVDLNYNRFSVSLDSQDKSQQWLGRLADVRMSYLPVFSMFLPQEERRTTLVIEDELARGRVSTVVRNLLLNLRSAHRHEELVGILRRAFPSLEKMAIEFDQANDRYITVTYREQGRPKEFDVFSAGSGFQQFVYLFGFMLLREPTVILIDEPDVHLHGVLQATVLEELRRFVGSGKQVLFATHSRELIARMGTENILLLDEGQARRLRVAFDVYDALDRLGSLDPTQLPVVQAYRRVLVVEDESDWAILSSLCREVLGAAVWQETERRLGICYAKGNPWKSDMSKLRQQIQQVVGFGDRPLGMFVVADRDYHPFLGELRASLPSEHLRWHIWERAEIENYLLAADAVVRLLSPQNGAPLPVALFEESLRQEFGRLLESSRATVEERLLNALQDHSRRQQLGWDVARCLREARKLLADRWEMEKLSLADAKDVVLPGIKRWLQQNRLPQFSDRTLARTLRAAELPPEVHQLAREIASFAGVAGAQSSLS